MRRDKARPKSFEVNLTALWIKLKVKSSGQFPSHYSPLNLILPCDLLEVELSLRLLVLRRIAALIPDVCLLRGFLVIKGGLQNVRQHLLVEDGSCGRGHGRHNPHPIRWTSVAEFILIVQVLHETLAGGVMVHDGRVL